MEPDQAQRGRRPSLRGPEAPRALRLAAGIVVVIALAVAVGLIAMWPGEVEPALSEGLTARTERAQVEAVETAPCPPPQPGSCTEATARLESGPDEGREITLPLGGAGIAPELEGGDQVRVTATPAPEGGETIYNLTDFERRSPMLFLAVAFAALVIVFGRLRGALSLLGLGISLALIVLFVVPAILDGSSPLLVALVGSLGVMLATIALAHGLGPKSIAAMLGTALSLALVALLAEAAIELTHLTGLSSEEATLLNLNVAEVSAEGLLVAGMVIGALGVLDDVTVSQASTVLALRAARPGQGFGELYRGALGVGRDHVSATVNTLVLAYVGSSLPVLLLFSAGTVGFADVVNSEIVAKEIVAMLVGSIGLIAAVPLTTALAALLARGLPEPATSEVAGAHAH
jgi:uncharacterized membrane protein